MKDKKQKKFMRAHRRDAKTDAKKRESDDSRADTPSDAQAAPFLSAAGDGTTDENGKPSRPSQGVVDE